MTWWQRLRYRNDLERQLDAELGDHLERLTADYIAAGMPEEDARRRARLEFGGLEQVKEVCRDVRPLRLLDDAAQDMRYALRTLARNPMFTAVIVLTLALGIGLTTGIFSVVSAVLFRPLPYRDADRLVRIVENVPAEESFRGTAMRMSAMSQDEFFWWRSHTKTLSHMAATVPESRTFMTPDGTVRLAGARVSADWFQMYGETPVLGRWLRRDEERPDANVVVLSTATWHRHFASDPTALARSIVLDDRAYSVIGVMPSPYEEFAFWIPIYPEPARPGATTLINVTARLGDGVPIERATAEVNVLGAQLRDGRPQSGSSPRFEVVRMQDQMVAAVRPAMRVLLAAVGVVLLIVCANTANLLLARGTTRQREIAIRRALGAKRGRIVRQVLTESVVLSVAGGAAGIAIAVGAVAALKSLALYDLPDRFRGALGSAVLDRSVIPRIDEVGVDGTMLAFVIGITALTGILFGIAPALRLSRVDHSQALAQANLATRSDGTVRGRNHLGHALAVAQLALATTLLVGTGLLVQSFVKLSSVDIGFDADVLSFELVLPRQYTPAQKVALARQVSDRLQSLPGVVATGFTNRPPLSGSSWTGPVVPFDRDWRQLERDEMAMIRAISPDYLRALGVRLLVGTWLQDGADGSATMLVNRAYARRFFGTDGPIGGVVRWGTVGSFQIVGVVDDMRLNFPTSPDAEPELTVFLEPRQTLASMPDSMRQTQENLVGGVAGTVSFAVRTNGDPLVIAPDLRGILRQVDPALAVEGVTTLERVVSGLFSRPRFYAVVVGIFGAIAGLIAAVGIYGVLAYGVTQRTQEIGIRIALGARPVEVLGLVLREGAALVVIGITLGLFGAIGLTRYLAALLFGLTPLDAPTYAVVAIAFAAVAMLASYVPARRATKVDPLVALRCE